MWKYSGGNGRRRSVSNGSICPNCLSTQDILAQETFTKMVSVERKRAERSGRCFILMLLEASRLIKHGTNLMDSVLATLAASTRETDIRGWYTKGSVLGVIFTEIDSADPTSTAHLLSRKMSKVLSGSLGEELAEQVHISCHVYPEDHPEGSGRPTDSQLYPDLRQKRQARTGSYIVKRSIDIFGSLFALVVSSPGLLVIAIAIKLTSKGPVLFRQARVGQDGKLFTFFKFRSMYVGNDAAVHRKYVKELIAGTANTEPHRVNGQVYKLTRDSRITRIGGFLRRTSLDEMPQFLNVLKGDMSLVGPRPPIPYELDNYDAWHKRRVLTIKPGLTGPWQVGGRNKMKFDEMVRLDLQYAASWSVWLDLKILFRTPRAVLTADGA